MAKRTVDQPEKLEFHVCDTPRGMEYYNFEILTPDQQARLNRHKTETIRDNQKYLFKNPEIRAIIQLVTRKIFLDRPSHDIESYIGRYFSENWKTITDEVNSYVESLPGKPKPDLRATSLRDDKHVTVDEQRLDDTSTFFSGSSEGSLTASLVREIVEELVDKTHEISTMEESVEVEGIDEKSVKKSMDEDDEFYFDLGLDFELDFSGYHEDDDKE